MAQGTLTLSPQQRAQAEKMTKARSYWGMVGAKIWADKITVFGMSTVDRANDLLARLMASATPPISDEQMDGWFIAWDQLSV